MSAAATSQLGGGAGRRRIVYTYNVCANVARFHGFYGNFLATFKSRAFVDFISERQIHPFVTNTLLL